MIKIKNFIEVFLSENWKIQIHEKFINFNEFGFKEKKYIFIFGNLLIYKYCSFE